MDLVIASRNKNKITEIREKFSGLKELRLIPLYELESPPEVIEDGETFEENAIKKAEEIARYSNRPVLSDDSGLVVEALDGRPGVHSARYGGYGSSDSKKNELLLSEMADIKENRKAKFVCVVAIAWPDGENSVVRGECYGEIAIKPAGEKGFGYDPVFFIPEFGKTMAQLSLEEKNRISHRALALDKAKNILEEKIRG
jgi:XTP/dITP diphosphohydrolase